MMRVKRSGGRWQKVAAALALALVALSGTATAALLPPLPQPPGLPSVPLPTTSNPSPSSSQAPPRPSRSPPSRCSGSTAGDPIAFILPVFPCDFPDPMVLRAGGTYYAYASATGWETGGAALPVLRSTDLRRWTSVGNALPHPPHWAVADLWGPSVIRWRGRYLLFYNALDRSSRNHCLAVARATVPQGPFVPQKRLMCARNGYRGFIDPAPLAVGHKLLLFFSVDGPRRHSLGAVALTAGGLKVTGPVHRLLGVSRRWRGLNSRTVEGPWPMRRNGTYYLFYSTGSWDSDYRMSFARATRPLGPYSDAAPLAMLGEQAQLPAPGGGSVFSTANGHNWLAFAAWTTALGYTSGGARTLRVAPLAWTRGRPAVRLGAG